MGRPKGSRNKRTLLREAEQFVGSKYVDQVLDSLYVIEKAAQHFFIRAEMGKHAGRNTLQVDEDYKQAAALAALARNYRQSSWPAIRIILHGSRTMRALTSYARRLCAGSGYCTRPA